MRIGEGERKEKIESERTREREKDKEGGSEGRRDEREIEREKESARKSKTARERAGENKRDRVWGDSEYVRLHQRGAHERACTEGEEYAYMCVARLCCACCKKSTKFAL